jgi:carbon storage regulator
MLVVSRKKMEEVVIGDDVIVTVLEVKGSQVRLGIVAPKSTKVFRKELVLDEEYLKIAQAANGG